MKKSPPPKKPSPPILAANVDTYVRKPERVKATQIIEPKFITTADGNEYFRPGDWLVVDGHGDTHRCEDWVFKTRFEKELPPQGR